MILIEVCEDFGENDFNSNEKTLLDSADDVIEGNQIKEIQAQNIKLQQEIEALKRSFEREKIIMNARIKHHENSKQRYLNDIHSLKKQIGQLKKEIDELEKELEKERNSSFGDLNVRVFT